VEWLERQCRWGHDCRKAFRLRFQWSLLPPSFLYKTLSDNPSFEFH
jgi:hypothetical protein